MNSKRIICVEISHKSAPISVRERVALNKEQVVKVLKEYEKYVDELFILSTCNRTAFYAYTEDYHPFVNIFTRFGNINRYIDVFSDSEQAVRNLFNTAAGIESQAIGEHQILGQIRYSYDIAKPGLCRL